MNILLDLLKSLINFSPLQLLTFALAGGALGGWVIFSTRDRDHLWRRWAIIMVVLHLGVSALRPGAFDFAPLAIDLVLLGSLGFGALAAKAVVIGRSRWKGLMMALVLVAVVSLLRILIAFSSLPKLPSLMSTDKEFQDEFLVEIPDDMFDSFYRKYKYQISSIRKAFDIDAEVDTELSEYYLLDIKDNKMADFLEIIGNIQYCDWIEENEVVQVTPILSDISPKTIQRSTSFNDPFLKEQWALEALGIGASETPLQPKRSVLLAILDTGVDEEHEDISSNFVRTPGQTSYDKVGHGTHCAGVAGAVVDNGIGVASPLVNPELYRLTSIKVLDDRGLGKQADIIQGMITAVDAGADVLSMSLGGISNDSRQRAYNQAVQYANRKGSIVVVAAGNAGMDANRYAPANAQNVICVAAVDKNLNKASFSNDISTIQYGIYAPGVGILSTYPDDNYRSLNGTSMATPYVSALVATVLSYSPGLNTDEVFDILVTEGSQSSPNIISFPKALEKLRDTKSTKGKENSTGWKS